MDALYKHLYHHILASLLQKPIFKVTLDKEKIIKIEDNFNRDELSNCTFKLIQVKEFITQYRTDILSLSIGDDSNQDASLYSIMKESVDSLLNCLSRFTDGSKLFMRLIAWPKLTETVKDLMNNSDDIKALKKITTLDFLSQGIAISQIGCLLEAFIANTVDIDSIGSLIEMADSFLSDKALNLIIGRKLLQDAFSQSLKKVQNYKSKHLPAQDRLNEIREMRDQGFRLLKRSCLQVDIGTACFEMMRNFMYSEYIQLLVSKVNAIHWVQKNMAQKEIKAPQSMETDKEECLIMACEFFEELHYRITQLDSQATKSKEETKKQRADSRYTGINLFAQQLSKEQNSYQLEALKLTLLDQCMKCESPVFHFELYGFLYQRLGAIKDLMQVQSKYAKEFIQTLNLQDDTSRGQQMLFDQRLEATFLHFKNLHDYAQAFRYILKQLCLERNKMDITQRITWLEKAKGCILLSQQQKSTMNVNDSEIEQLNTYRGYFYLQQQLRDCLQQKISKLNKKGGEVLIDEIERMKAVEIQFTQEVIDTEVALNVALSLKKYDIYLRLILVTEVQLSKPIVPVSETQSRIDFMYQALLDTKYPLQAEFDPKKTEKLIDILTFLRTIKVNQSLSDSIKQQPLHQAKIELFPVKLMIEHLIVGSNQRMKQTQDLSDPEDFLGLAYFYLKWTRSPLRDQNVLENSKIRASKPDMMVVAHSLRASIAEAHLFAKDYHSALMELSKVLEQTAKEA